MLQVTPQPPSSNISPSTKTLTDSNLSPYSHLVHKGSRGLTTHLSDGASSAPSSKNLSVLHNSSSERTRHSHSSQIIGPKPVFGNSVDRYKNDDKGLLADRMLLSRPKYELVFSRTPKSAEHRHHRCMSPTNVTRPAATTSRIPSKPFRCPKSHCSRTFSNESALNYHSKHGYCNSLDLSLIYNPSSSGFARQNHRSDGNGVTTPTANPTDIPTDVFPPKTVGSNARRDVKGKQPESLLFHPFSRRAEHINTQSTTDRGRSTQTLHRSISLPNLHRSNPTLPPWLTAFPPPTPFAPQKCDRVSLEHDVMCPKKEVLKSHRNEQGIKRNSQDNFGSLHLSRSLSTSRPSERDPVLGRPYSQFPSRPSSIRTSSGTPPAPTSFSSSYLRIPTKSFQPSQYPIKPAKNASKSRLARPLPLPPNSEHDNRLRAAREKEWGAIARRNSGLSSTQTSISPRTPSPQISIRRFARPPSPRPSSLSSSFSRNSSMTSLSRPSSVSSLRYSPSSSPNTTFLSPSYRRTSAPLSDPSPPPLPIPRLQIRPTHRERPLSWREKVRRGFWNRRGDFLTEDGFIVYAPPDRAFPDDLITYPAETEGYQDHELEFARYIPRPELPESLPRRGRPPERPYDSFLVYVYK